MAHDENPLTNRRGAKTKPAATTEPYRRAEVQAAHHVEPEWPGSDSDRSEFDAYSTKILNELRSLNAYLEARL